MNTDSMQKQASASMSIGAPSVAKHLLQIAAAAAAMFCATSIARAQSFSRLLQEPWSGNDLAETYDHPIIQNAGHIDNGNSDSQVIWWDSFGRVRFDRNDALSPFIGYRVLTIGASTDGRYIKATMDEIDAAVGIHLGNFSGWNVGTMLGAGFSSTHPFVNPSGVFGIGHVTGERAIDDHNSLLLSVDYEGNAGLLPDVPLPGFAWIHRSKEFDAVLGFPLSRVRWNPLAPLTIAAQYNVPFSATVDAEYKVVRHVGLYANAANFFQGFVTASGDITNRQFYQMRRVEAGLRLIDRPLVDASIGVGYAFDQEFSRGFDVRNIRPIGRISNEPYIAIVLRGTF
jgi:hypothetical protein